MSKIFIQFERDKSRTTNSRPVLDAIRNIGVNKPTRVHFLSRDRFSYKNSNSKL